MDSNYAITGTTACCTTLAQVTIPRTERKMIEPHSYAAFSFLLYVVAFCLLLTFLYIAVNWLCKHWTSFQYDRKQEIEKLQYQIKALESKKSGGA